MPFLVVVTVIVVVVLPAGVAGHRRRSVDLTVVPPHEPGQRFKDVYSVYERLAAGGFGTVFRAVHRATGTHVAVKKIAALRQGSREAYLQSREIDIMKTVRPEYS